jgi:hypothetical protein
MRKLKTVLAGPVKPGLYRLLSRTPRARQCREIEQAGWRCICVDGRVARDKAAFLDMFAQALSFPAYFGRNWDAFEECLNDLAAQWRDEGLKVAIVYDGADALAEAAPHDWETARSIFESAVKTWQPAGLPILVLLLNATMPGDIEVL